MFSIEEGISELGMVLLLVVCVQLIRIVVGKILALLLKTTRRDVLVLDCSDFETEFENDVYDRIVLKDLMRNIELDKDMTIREERHFEWLEGQSAQEIPGSVC